MRAMLRGLITPASVIHGVSWSMTPSILDLMEPSLKCAYRMLLCELLFAFCLINVMTESAGYFLWMFDNLLHQLKTQEQPINTRVWKWVLTEWKWGINSGRSACWYGSIFIYLCVFISVWISVFFIFLLTWFWNMCLVKVLKFSMKRFI